MNVLKSTSRQIALDSAAIGDWIYGRRSPHFEALVLLQTDTVIDLPWLAPYDKIMVEVGYGGHIIKTTAPAGSDIATNPARKQARIKFPDGRTKAWDGDAEISIDPSSPSWRVTWRVPGTLDKVALGFEPFEELDEDCDVGVVRTAQIYADDFEGQESRFADFVRIMKDPLINPYGFDFSDGRYRQEGGRIHFDIQFDPPSFRARPETLPAELTFPNVTDIRVITPITITDRNTNKTVQPGYYRASVTGSNIYTGEAVNIRCKPLGDSAGGQFSTNGGELTQLIHEEKIEIMRVVQDHKPNY